VLALPCPGDDMSRFVGMAAMLALVALGLPCAALRAAPAEAAMELRTLTKSWDEAYLARDAAALGRLLADEYTLTDASGAVINRTAYLMSLIKSPDISRATSFASEDVEVHVYGDAAVVTGSSPVKGRARGRSQAFSDRYRFIDVWVKQQGSWKAVATQATRVAAERP
jgi:ketosteroid isomerase-like protein